MEKLRSALCALPIHTDGHFLISLALKYAETSPCFLPREDMARLVVMLKNALDNAELTLTTAYNTAAQWLFGISADTTRLFWVRDTSLPRVL